MYFRHLDYLRLVIAHGSFAAAAQAGSVTQSAISHGMKQLQAELGHRLFTRVGRRLVPTEFALQLARESVMLADRVDALTGTVSRPVDAGLLRIGLTPSAALVCGLALYTHWCGDATGRSLQLHSADEGQLLASLSRREVDFVISPRPRGYREVHVACEPLYRLQPMVWARRGHALATAHSLEDLQHANWAIVGPSVRGPVNVLTEAFSVRNMEPPHVMVSCPDYPSMLNLVAHTDLLAVVPHPALVSGELSPLIASLKLRETLPLYEMWLFHAAPLGVAMAEIAQQLLHSLASTTGSRSRVGDDEDTADGRAT
ncbi:LysR family transcriptional regulator [Variovorax ginsengisoli]|uniref:DNA-binding transcriptional LysR family regulator n=1 Tax=Variovorax ginsengisoli TaxID=363844 RepID=A0ABT9SGB3_9BURK|nr:LysR family transcriptional regulator [Variovorax ginsengisoli]MDP9902432.1 DNA-binding transcriptional LysR family regulator [Variovorax ginsengisoli]